MIEWNKIYSLGISEIDEEHIKLIGIINKAILAKEHNSDPEELKEVLNEMTKYARTHFATEELYMTKFNYPKYQSHKEEHLDFAAKIKAYERGLINAEYNIEEEILDYLREWLIHHILTTDKKYVGCFKENGIMRETKNQEKMRGPGSERRQSARRSGISRRSGTSRRSDKEQ